MSVKKQFMNLKECYKSATSDNERAAIMDQIFDLMHEHPEVRDIAKAEATKVVDRVSGELIKERLAPVLEALSAKWMANTFFGKPATWFYQRINGNIINGHTCTFSHKDAQTLKEGLLKLSDDIRKAAESL